MKIKETHLRNTTVKRVVNIKLKLRLQTTFKEQIVKDGIETKDVKYFDYED